MGFVFLSRLKIFDPGIGIIPHVLGVSECGYEVPNGNSPQW